MSESPLVTALFIVCLLAGMMIIQTVRFAVLFKKHNPCTTPVYVVVWWVISLRDAPKDRNLFIPMLVTYLSVISGNYIASYRKYLTSLEYDTFESQVVKMHRLAPSFVSDVLIPHVVAPVIEQLKDERDLVEDLTALVQRLRGGLIISEHDREIEKRLRRYAHTYAIDIDIVHALLENKVAEIASGRLRIARCTFTLSEDTSQ